MLPNPSSDDAVVLLRQKHMLLQVRDKGDGALQRRPNLQWRAQQLLRLAEELQAEWQEAQLLQDLEQVRPARRLSGAAGWAEEARTEAEVDPEEPAQAQRGVERAPRPKEKHRVVLREHKSRQEELPRRRARRSKARRRAAGAERQGATKTRGLGPTEKNKRKRIRSRKTSGGRRPADPRVCRGMNPLLATAEELRCLQEKQRAREGRRKARRGTAVRFSGGLRNISEDLCSEDRLDDFQQLWSVGSTHKRDAVDPTSPDKCGARSKWQRELEFAFEQLFNTNRKLKRHLNLHLDSRSRKDQHPEEQASSATQGCGSDTPPERVAEVETPPAEECGDPAEAETPQMSSKTDLQQLLSKAELLTPHPAAQPAAKEGSQTTLPEAETTIDDEDLLSKSTECEREARELAALVEGCPQAQSQEQAHRADWMAVGQRPRLEPEWRRQKALSESTELPDMSLEIHYSAELEEERKERRRVRLALLRSYPSRYQIKDLGSPYRVSSPSSSSIIDDEEKQNQMIRDIQQQISEQNKLHEQFLEKARKRLLEFQRIC